MFLLKLDYIRGGSRKRCIFKLLPGVAAFKQVRPRAIADGGCLLPGDCPKTSPDLNATEGVWKMLRDGLLSGAPSALESRL